MNLRLFIGSSSESLPIAQAISQALKDEIDCTIWTDSFFKLSHTSIESLSAGVDKFDAGIFVFGEDDALISRGADFYSPRDNVVFECGLFCGHLGPKRTFVVRPKSRALKWLSDLQGFTPAQYDEVLARTDVDRAIKPACDEIRSQLRYTDPKPGIFVKGKWRQLDRGWWTYGLKQTSNFVVDKTGVQLFSESNIGIRFPEADNLDAVGRYCSIRIMPSLGAVGGCFYVAVTAGKEEVLLSISATHTLEGWGIPPNEFMIRLPHLSPDRFQGFVVDLEALEPLVGRIARVNGFRLRPGLKVSHICVSDDLPIWLREATILQAQKAPRLTIEHPWRAQ